jgi:hypothetical protein
VLPPQLPGTAPATPLPRCRPPAAAAPPGWLGGSWSWSKGATPAGHPTHHLPHTAPAAEADGSNHYYNRRGNSQRQCVSPNCSRCLAPLSVLPQSNPPPLPVSPLFLGVAAPRATPPSSPSLLSGVARLTGGLHPGQHPLQLPAQVLRLEQLQGTIRRWIWEGRLLADRQGHDMGLHAGHAAETMHPSSGGGGPGGLLWADRVPAQQVWCRGIASCPRRLPPAASPGCTVAGLWTAPAAPAPYHSSHTPGGTPAQAQPWLLTLAH